MLGTVHPVGETSEGVAVLSLHCEFTNLVRSSRGNASSPEVGLVSPVHKDTEGLALSSCSKQVAPSAARGPQRCRRHGF